MINALHFKCSWHFESFNTSEEYFYVTSSNKTTVNMMTLCDELEYHDDDDELKFSVLKLPYIVCINFFYFFVFSFFYVYSYLYHLRCFDLVQHFKYDYFVT